MVYPQQQQMGYGYPRTSGLCVAGMVLGIIALVGCWVPFGGVIIGLVGLILSAAGMRQARQPGRTGFGMGVTGLICSIISLIPAVILLIAFFSAAAGCGLYC